MTGNGVGSGEAMVMGRFSTDDTDAGAHIDHQNGPAMNAVVLP